MGVELAFADNGVNGPGVPLVLLHAFPLTGHVFDPLLEELSAFRRRVIRPDLRGFGGSPGPGDDEPSLDLMADDVAALLDRLELDRVVLGGVSLGGYVAMAMLRGHRSRVESVVLMDTKASADTEDARANRERAASAVLRNGSRALRPMLDTLLGVTTRRERPEVVEAVTAWLDAARPHGVAWAQRAMAERPSSFETLAAAALPIVVIVGDEDALTGRDDARAMSEACRPPAPVHVIADAGHLAPMENPDAVAGVLRDVLGRSD